MSARRYTNELIEMIEQGLLSQETVINACLKYMSEADVEDMMRCNDFIEDDD